MKVTICTHDAPRFVGGPHSWLRRIAPDFRAAGIECEILFFIDSETPAHCPSWEDLKAKGFDCRAFCGARSLFSQVRWLLSEVAAAPPDVFINNLSAAGLYAGRWLKAAGIPTVGILHSDDEYYRTALQKFVFGNASEQLTTVVCVSKFIEQYVHSFGETQTLVTCIPYGVPIPEDKAVFLAEQPMQLVYAGRLVEEQKRISEVARAMCRAVAEVHDTQAVIYGGGHERANVIGVLKAEGQELPIRLGGRVDSARIQQKMLEAQVVVLLSDYEGLPIVLLEAMACGLVPICLDIRSGIPELIEHGVTGLLVRDRGDGFVAAVRRLREDVGLCDRISRQARAKIIRDYSHGACMQKWISLLNELIPTTKDVEKIRRQLRKGHRVLRFLNDTLSVEA